MAARQEIPICQRKLPRQRRSRRMVDDIVQAAARVLARDGALRFTTARVAEAAGVSVGSLYQYFPNKQALLYRLQRQEWEATLARLERVLGRGDRRPELRLHEAIVLFFRSEAEEAPLRRALDDAGALLRDSPAAHQLDREVQARIREVFGQLLPGADARDRDFAGELVRVVVSSVAERVTATRAGRADVERWAAATARMVTVFVADARRTARGARGVGERSGTHDLRADRLRP